MKKSDTAISGSEFQTQDLYLSACLKTAEIKLLKVENHNGRGVFIFSNSQKIPKIIADYFNNGLKLDSKLLFENWKSLKSLVFATIDREV